MERDCCNCRFEHYGADEIPCIACGMDERKQWQPKPKTNADRIRAMTDEELAKFLANEIPHGDCCGCDLECATFEGDRFENSCHNAFYRWLKQPAEGETNEN